MKPMHQVAAAGAVCLLLAGALWALTYTFNPPGSSGDWSNQNNWGPHQNAPPGADDDAIIKEDKTVIIDVEDREVMELWLQDDTSVDLQHNLCANVRLFVYRVSGVSGNTLVEGTGEGPTKEICAAEVRVAEKAVLTVGVGAAVRTLPVCTCPN